MTWVLSVAGDEKWSIFIDEEEGNDPANENEKNLQLRENENQKNWSFFYPLRRDWLNVLLLRIILYV